MRREYVQASDRKANTQARYAAETAINDARRKIYSEINTRLNDSSTKDLLQEPFDHGEMFEDYGCTNNSAKPGYNPDLDGATKDGIEYTCVTVSNSQENLIYDAISNNRSRLIIIQGVKDVTNLTSVQTSVPTNPDQFTIKWDNINPDDNTNSDFAINGGVGGHNNVFPNSRSWTYGSPVLRVQFIPINIGHWDKSTNPATFKGGFNRDDLAQESFTWFLYPSLHDPSNTDDTSVDSVDIHNGTTPDGAIIPVRCNATTGDGLPCGLTIKKMDTFQRKTPADSQNNLVYIIKVLPIYAEAARLKISDGKFYDTSKTPATVEDLRFVNEQIGITATGRSGSVTYRTTEIIPVLPPYDRPEYAIDSAEDICKLISGNSSGTVIGGAFTKTPNINYYTPTTPSALPSSCRFN